MARDTLPLSPSGLHTAPAPRPLLLPYPPPARLLPPAAAARPAATGPCCRPAADSCRLLLLRLPAALTLALPPAPRARAVAVAELLLCALLAVRLPDLPAGLLLLLQVDSTVAKAAPAQKGLGDASQWLTGAASVTTSAGPLLLSAQRLLLLGPSD